LEKHYKEGLSNEEGLKLVVKALLDVVESGNKNIEVMVIGQAETRLLNDEEIEKLIEIAKQ
jgi:20S proteasome subunit alpha 4